MEMEAKKEKFVLMQDDHLSDEASTLLVQALLHGEMTDVPENLLSHVEACRGCKDKIMEVVTFLRNPDSAGDLKQKLRKKAKARRDWYFYRGKIAAIFVACALLAGAYFFIYKNPSFQERFLSDSTTKKPQKIQAKTTTPTKINANEKKAMVGQNNKDSDEAKTNATKAKNGQTLHNRYRVNPNLENMIGSRVRSGFFEVIGPENGSVLKTPIHFSWKRDLVEPHTLKIVDNKNYVLHMYPVNGTWFDFREILPSGLYYWKLESQNELLYVGKFFVGRQ